MKYEETVGLWLIKVSNPTESPTGDFPFFSSVFNYMQIKNPEIQGITGLFICFHRTFVELEGVEPSSKQGNHTLSTRLFQTSVFECQQDLDHQLTP